ncbi:hypothetical protein [Streptomyces sp. 351MFTsu5.1]|uniref:hypothetical protein n=1 Tax=Streptomyces sp. 351MFTsu5.1 TaxID=1172180 RepID=UPI00036F52F7|nr:hypothetical protein [Streptomyces sp. 351MFTsu5.1]
MAPRPLKAALTLAAAAAFSLSAVPAQAADPAPTVWTDLTPTYTATGAYGYAPLAVADGFVPMSCVPGMGYHYVNADNVGETDPERPAALLYDDGPHGRRLLGVEWIVPAGSGVTRPTLFGQEFQGPADVPGVGSSYTLHAWIYRTNPSGLFKPTDPDVTCAPASAPSTAPEPDLLAGIDWTALVT